MNQKSLPTDSTSEQDRQRRLQLGLQLTSAALTLAGAVLAYLQLSVLLAGGLTLAGLAALLLTPRV